LENQLYIEGIYTYTYQINKKTSEQSYEKYIIIKVDRKFNRKENENQFTCTTLMCIIDDVLLSVFDL